LTHQISEALSSTQQHSAALSSTRNGRSVPQLLLPRSEECLPDTGGDQPPLCQLQWKGSQPAHLHPRLGRCHLPTGYSAQENGSGKGGETLQTGFSHRRLHVQRTQGVLQEARGRQTGLSPRCHLLQRTQGVLQEARGRRRQTGLSPRCHLLQRTQGVLQETKEDKKDKSSKEIAENAEVRATTARKMASGTGKYPQCRRKTRRG